MCVWGGGGGGGGGAVFIVMGQMRRIQDDF